MADQGESLSARLHQQLGVIEVRELGKTYANGTEAVRGISFQVHKGEIFGLLGPNGAGKSTTIGMLGTLVRPTKGIAYVGGINVAEDPAEVRPRIGFAMQEAGVDSLATGHEFLRLQARLYGVPKKTADKRADQLLRLFELEDAGDKRIGSYSGGMRRRIDLAAALIHMPRIIFLDEPTEGLDPRSRQKLWRTLKRLRERLGATILLSTHYMEEADYLCDRVAIIDRGRIVAEDTPERLKRTLGGDKIVLSYPDESGNEAPAAARDLVLSKKLGLEVSVVDSSVHVTVQDAAASAPKILKALDAGGLSPRTLSIQQPTLDDVYLKFTGKTLTEHEEADA